MPPLVDGTGAARFSGDVALRGDRIVAVSRTPLPRARANRVIEARGLIVAPGFIDLHAHIDPLLNQPDATSDVRQGDTLALGCPDGGGPWPHPQITRIEDDFRHRIREAIRAQKAREQGTSAADDVRPPAKR